MTSRDTHDIEEYEREVRVTARAAKKKNEPSPEFKKILERMMDIARWHAQLQVSFDRVLMREVEASNDN